jgi:hypothetical protein
MRGNTPQAGIDLARTETFLRSIPDVLDASVWWGQGMLQAQVTLQDSNPLDQRHLQRLCMDTLGLHQTPREIRVVRCRPRVA